MPAVFLATHGRVFLVFHALLAMGLLGSSVHQAVLATVALRRQLRRPRLLRTYALVALLTYLATWLTGALVYPRYRYLVRGLYLDRYASWAANLFDLKENLATIGLPLAVGTLLLSRNVKALRGDRQAQVLFGVLSLFLAGISLFAVVSGFLVAGVRGY